MAPPADAIARAAKRQRSRRARARARAARQASDTAESRAIEQGEVEAHMVLDAFEADETTLGAAIQYAAIGVVTVALFGLEYVTPLHRWMTDDLGFAVAGTADLIAAIPLAFKLGDAWGWWQRRRFRDVGYGLDVDGYLSQLRHKRDRGQLAIVLHFDRAWPGPHGAQLADAVREWADATVEVVDARALRVVGPDIDTYFSEIIDAEVRNHYSNQLVHRYLRRVLERVVRPLDAIASVVRIDVEIRGPLQPWDAATVR